MNPQSLCRSPGILPVALILCAALASQGAPAARSGDVGRSVWHSEMTHQKDSGKVPLLPPDEDVEAESDSDEPMHSQGFEEEDVSGASDVSGFDSEGISGSDSIDALDYNYLFLVGKSGRRGVDREE